MYADDDDANRELTQRMKGAKTAAGRGSSRNNFSSSYLPPSVYRRLHSLTFEVDGT